MVVFMRLEYFNYIRFQLNLRNVASHHRDTEDTEDARRLESNSTLCATSVRSVPLW